MPYGQIFAGTFKTIWHHKKLWGFGLLGYLLLALGNGIYFGMAFRWQRRWWDFFFDPMGTPLPAPLANQMVRGLVWLWVGLGLLLLALLCGYAVNLVMRGATIGEAAAAWQGQQTQAGRGLRTGLRRAGHLFVIDMVWWIPSVLFVIAGYVAGTILFFVVTRGISGGWGPGGRVGLAFAGAIGLVLYLLALILIVAILYGVFAPLMYQAVVQGQRNLGAGIKEGWRLARANLGPMLIFWLLTLGVSLGLSVVTSLLTLPLMAPWLANWFGSWIVLMNQLGVGKPPLVQPLPGMSGLLVALAALGAAFSGWLYGSLLQTFVLTMYAEVYRRLAGRPASAEATPTEPPKPPTPAEVKDGGLIVPEEPAPPAAEEGTPYL